MIERMIVSLSVPVRLLHRGEAVRIVARDGNGSFGVLPNHVDFATALVPSALAMTGPDGGEAIFGIDEGVMVKRGARVELSVRRAVTGADLDELRQIVRERFVEMDEQERSARAALSRLEADIVRRFAELKELR